MILIRMLPEQVMERWEYIKPTIVAALPPFVNTNAKQILTIQAQLLVGELVCWVAAEAFDSNVVYGTMVTGVVTDPFSDTKNIVIYTVTITGVYPIDLWETSYAVLRKYAASVGAYKIVSYTNQPRVIDIAKSLGADVEWALIQLEV